MSVFRWTKAESSCDISGDHTRDTSKVRPWHKRAQEKCLIVTIDRDIAAPLAIDAEKVELKAGRELIITYDKRKTDAGKLLQAVSTFGLGIVDVSTREADLEKLMALCGRRRQDAA